jgi:mRNA-degrading endonuclease toxin of MazEF toxin-antitoxin module
MELKKYGVYRADFPEQEITRRGESGRPLAVTGTEQHGPHPCVVVSVDDNNQFAVVCPLTSAQNQGGGERFNKVKKTWLRVNHGGKPGYVLTEQIRYADLGRFYGFEGFLDEYDQQQLELKLKALLGFL